MIFIPAEKNSANLPLLVASNEVSGTVSVTALEIDAPKTPEVTPTPADPKLPPKTGDGWNTYLAALGIAFAGGCALGLSMRKKRMNGETKKPLIHWIH